MYIHSYPMDFEFRVFRIRFCELCECVTRPRRIIRDSGCPAGGSIRSIQPPPHTGLDPCSKPGGRGAERGAAARAPARAAARERRAGERCCIFWAFDVLSSDPVEIVYGIPRPGRTNRRLGLVNRRSAQSRLAGEFLLKRRGLLPWVTIEGLEKRFCVRMGNAKR